MKESEVYIFGEITSQPVFGGISAEMVRTQIDPSSDVINVHIASPGGEVWEGYSIYNTLKGSGKKINVFIEGLCASMATVVAMAGDYVVMSPLAEFMIHNPMVGIQGDQHDLRDAADQLENMKQTIIGAYKKKTGLDEKALSKLMDEETYMTPDKAKELGFVDEVRNTLKAVAKVDLNKLKSMESKEVNEKLNLLEVAVNKIMNILMPAPKNYDATLKDGTKVIVEGEGIQENLSIFENKDGNKSPLENGQYTLSDDSILTVTDGKISAIKKGDSEQPVDYKAQFEAMKAQFEAMTLERDTLKNSLEEKENKFNELAAEMNTIKTELTAFKNFVPKGSDQAPPVKPLPTAEVKEQLSLFGQNLKERFKQRQ